MDPDAGKFAAVRRALLAARYTNGDNIPCQIEEVQIEILLVLDFFILHLPFCLLSEICTYVHSLGSLLGSATAGLNMVELKKLNITPILTMDASLPPAYPDEFTYKVVRV